LTAGFSLRISHGAGFPADGRDRAVGEGTLPLELLVRSQTADAARLFGLDDRGVLAVGKRADINVIDMEKLCVLQPFWANDLPTNAGRWLQYTQGYRCTVLRGEVTFENDRHTGALPGRLVRNPAAIGAEAAASRCQLRVRSTPLLERPESLS
jgi:N-acyl-D-aspartate/D-glutamate deacylase